MKITQSLRPYSKIISNTNWLVWNNIVITLIGILVGIQVTRYLGPERYGIFSYAIAFFSIFTALSGLGLGNIIISSLVNNFNQRNKIMGSAFRLRIGGSVFFIIVGMVIIRIIKPENELMHILVFILLMKLFFNSIDIINFWFDSMLKSKYKVITRNLVAISIASVKIFLVYVKAPLLHFIYAFLLDSILIAVLLLVFYKASGESFFSWKINKRYMKNMMTQSWPLYLSMVFIMLYTKIDQLMIGNFLGNINLGYYSTAVRLSEMTYFFPFAVATSLFPAIIKNVKNQKFQNKVQGIFDFFTWFTIILSTIVLLLSSHIISFIYGVKFLPAAKVLAVHIWSTIFVFSGYIITKILVAQKKTKIELYRNGAAVIVNILLNIIFIPKFGIVGAAIATLLSQFTATYFILFFTDTRVYGAHMLKSFNLFRIFTQIYKKRKIEE